MPVAVYLHGRAAQRAAEAEVVRQGAPAGVLAEYRIRLDEKAGGFVLALAIAVCLTALAGLNLARNPNGQIMSWIAEPLVLVAVGFVCAAHHRSSPVSRSGRPGNSNASPGHRPLRTKTRQTGRM